MKDKKLTERVKQTRPCYKVLIKCFCLSFTGRLFHETKCLCLPCWDDNDTTHYL